MKRKVIQIALGIYQGSGAMALCDDGTMWFMDAPHSSNSTWHQIANVPQEEIPVFCKTTYQELIETKERGEGDE